MEKLQNIILKIQALKPELYSEFAIKRIGVFGSYVRGEANENSDLDLLIELENPVGWKFFSIEPYLESKLGVKVDLVTEKAIREEMRKAILSEVNFI